MTPDTAANDLDLVAAGLWTVTDDGFQVTGMVPTAAAWRARKRRQIDELLKRPGNARRIRSAETTPITFDGVPVADLPRPPDGD